MKIGIGHSSGEPSNENKDAWEDACMDKEDGNDTDDGQQHDLGDLKGLMHSDFVVWLGNQMTYK